MLLEANFQTQLLRVFSTKSSTKECMLVLDLLGNKWRQNITVFDVKKDKSSVQLFLMRDVLCQESGIVSLRGVTSKQITFVLALRLLNEVTGRDVTSIGSLIEKYWLENNG